MSGIMSRLVNDRDQLERATAHLDPPFAVVDLAAFDANAHDLVRRANGVPIRVVSKSLAAGTLSSAPWPGQDTGALCLTR